MSGLINYFDKKENGDDNGIPGFQLRYFWGENVTSQEVDLIKEIDEEFTRRKVNFLSKTPYEVNSTLYHRLPGVSSTGIREFIQDKKLFEHNLKMNDRKKGKQKEFFFIGDAIHQCLLGNGKIISESEHSLRVGPYHIDFERIELMKKNVFLIKNSDYDMVESWINTCKQNKTISKLFSSKFILTESPVFSLCKNSGLLIKFCPDLLDVDKGMILDIKSSADWENWERSVDRYGYDVQAAYYLYCADMAFGVGTIKSFYFLYLSKKAPYRVSIKAIRPKRVLQRKKEIPVILRDMADCMRKNEWGSLVSNEIEYA